MNSGKLTISQISGKSGVGKSRILKEISAQASFQEKEIFYWDNDFRKENFASLIRQIISQIEGLPLLPPANKSVYVSDQENREYRSMAVQILYSPDFLKQCPSEALIEHLKRLLCRKDIWIILDNVQSCDEETLGFLRIYC